MAITSAGTPAIADSQGTTFTFGGVSYKATKVTVKYGGDSAASGTQQIDVSTLDLPSGSDKVYQSPPLNEVTSAGGTGIVATIDVDFMGKESPTLNQNAGLVISSLSINGTAKCTAYDITLAVNDVIRGTASFDLVSTSPPSP